MKDAEIIKQEIKEWRKSNTIKPRYRVFFEGTTVGSMLKCRDTIEKFILENCLTEHIYPVWQPEKQSHAILIGINEEAKLILLERLINKYTEDSINTP